MTVQAKLAAYLAGQGTVEGVRSISTGWETEVYAYDLNGVPKVLRLYQGQHVEARAQNEYRMLRQLSRMGYPVPQVDHFNADPAVFGGPFLLMERLEGRPMAHLFRERPAAELVSELVGLMARLHAMDWRAFVGEGAVWPDLPTARGTFDTGWLVAFMKAVDLLDVTQPLLDWLVEQGRSVDFRLAPLHGDFHFDNVMVSPTGSTAVIDWGSTGVGDPRCDLGYCYILLSTHGRPELGEAIRQAYEQLAGPLAHFDYFITWGLIRRLVVTLTVLVRGSAAIGLRPGLEAQLREQIGYVRMLVGLVRERTGLNMDGVEALLEA